MANMQTCKVTFRSRFWHRRVFHRVSNLDSITSRNRRITFSLHSTNRVSILRVLTLLNRKGFSKLRKEYRKKAEREITHDTSCAWQKERVNKMSIGRGLESREVNSEGFPDFSPCNPCGGTGIPYSNCSAFVSWKPKQRSMDSLVLVVVVAGGAANVIFRAYNIEQVRLIFEGKRGQARTIIFLQVRKVDLISKKKKSQ